MKRITTLMGATAITIAAGGCAVVPAYDVYGPPVAGGFGPGGPWCWARRPSWSSPRRF